MILASHLNTALLPLMSELQTSTSSIPPTSSSSLARSTASLVAGLDWRKVAVLSDPEFSQLVGRELAVSGVCVVDSEAVPTILHTKDTYTRLLSELALVGVDRLVVAADGADIERLVENIYQLNLNMSVLALPWDGSVKEMPATDSENVDIIQLVQTFSNMPELAADLGLEAEHVMTWEVVRSLYGLLVEGQVGVDSDTVRRGLELTRQTEKFSVEKLSGSAGWRVVGGVESGQLSWAGLEPPQVTVRAGDSGGCENCQCVNGLSSPALVWRSELWLTVLLILAGLGLLSCLLLSTFLCSQCGQVLEGSQVTSFCLLSATSLLFLSLAPFCLLPHSLVCALRELGPPLLSSLVMSVMVSRSLLLATSDTDGLPGHASGALQVVLGLLLLGVEAAVILVLSLVRQGEGEGHTFTQLTNTGRVRSLQCSHGDWPWLLTMAWPGLLLLLQLCLSPAIWRSRRNYREGALFSLASLALCLVSAGWVAAYWVCSDLYGQHWQEISTAAGLVASASAIILVIFLPKVSPLLCRV